ncbi:RNA polymerase subunit sigma-70 [Actinacidiphila paucisporea]|uniref:RNA polymerase, sigma subunit, ECF family n=1 Tax=Actinacidiphila paucisporea TaxID=310782 RepID=A0A1M7P122_9ACTN|nr:RNA polymerase subunit sigma-70 [Actinacidiphila paucisporea]SHN10149.1 RNA polymerase, sigma subunit, ECF family [Actinacidiphila paucisporea]
MHRSHTEAARPDAAEFESSTEPFRRELLAHCYRLLGSLDDAEDLVQETYLRAWRYYGGFEGRSSVRVWLYRIATNACLRALKNRDRRPLPSGLGGPDEEADGRAVAADAGSAWLQPIPDALVTGGSDDPADVVAARAGLRLALIASLQYLPPKQRAVLILRDVLAFRAAEVAQLLDTTTTAVKSALQRARARLEEVVPVADQVTEPTDAQARALLGQYVAAFENADPEALRQLLRRDATLELPPSPAWFAGPRAAEHAVAGLGAPGDWQMVETAANGQPAAAVYRRGPDGRYHGYGVVVLTVTVTGISRITVFADPGLLKWFGLAAVRPAAPPFAGAR